jgi:hypothetical protein
MAIAESTYGLIEPGFLAAWLEHRGADSWWTVDGEERLAESIDFPCRGASLADEFRHVRNRLLRILGVSGTPETRLESEDELDKVAGEPNRVLRLSWDDEPSSEWLLVEDRDVAGMSE